MNQFRNKVAVFLIIAVTLLIVMISIQTYTSKINQQLQESVEDNLRDSVALQADNFETIFENDLLLLKSFGQTILTIGGNKEEILIAADEFAQTTFYEEIIIADINGDAINKNGDFFDARSIPIFEQVIDNQNIISNKEISYFSNESIVYIGTPLHENGNVVGALFVELSIDYFSNKLLPVYDGEGYTFLINQTGDIIAHTQSENVIAKGDNLFQELNKVQFIDKMSVQRVVEEIQHGVSNTINYYTSEEIRYAVYESIGASGWTIFTVIPDEVIRRDASAILSQTYVFSAIALGCIIILVLSILSFQNNSMREIETAAYIDDLTGIPNLVKFRKEASRILKRFHDKEFTIIKFDFVNFKSINELNNFEIGNKILIAVASVGKDVPVKPFLQARVGVDEFLLFAPKEFFKDFEKLRSIYENNFRQKALSICGHRFEFRYGRYEIEAWDKDINEIISKVTLAHKYAKDNKLEGACDYDADFNQNLIRVSQLVNKMEAALKSGEFKLFLQPKFNLKTKQIVGAEALVRWIEPTGKIIYPGDFIPVFEQNGFLTSLDSYMLRRTCEVIQRMLQEGKECVPISVNFSRVHIQNPFFVEEITTITDLHKIPRKFIEIEITESVILDNEDTIRRVVSELHRKGFTLSMDDFGSGYSSLSLLNNLDVDVIKLDRSFFKSAVDSERANTVVEHIVSMARELNITTVAEGVETIEQVEFLNEVNCEIAQGFYFARPMPADEFDSFCEEHQSNN